MSRPDHQQPLTFYPAYCYASSPTYFVWVKLTCHDVQHVLRTSGDRQHHQSSTGSPLYFYLNHPIQFVQLTGVVVAIEDFHPYIFLFTLDDSSGATVDVVWRKPKPPINENDPSTASAATKANANTDTEKDPSSPSLLPLLSTLIIGTTLVAKGTLNSFRSTLQLSLLRLTTLTTPQELSLTKARTSFLLSTLSKPWILSPSQQKKLLAKATGERDSESQRAVRARKRREQKELQERKDAEEVGRLWAEEEGERAREAERARRDGVEVLETVKQQRRWRRSTT